jgi:hypothetical protein
MRKNLEKASLVDYRTLVPPKKNAKNATLEIAAVTSARFEPDSRPQQDPDLTAIDKICFATFRLSKLKN